MSHEAQFHPSPDSIDVGVPVPDYRPDEFGIWRANGGKGESVSSLVSLEQANRTTTMPDTSAPYGSFSQQERLDTLTALYASEAPTPAATQPEGTEVQAARIREEVSRKLTIVGLPPDDVFQKAILQYGVNTVMSALSPQARADGSLRDMLDTNARRELEKAARPFEARQKRSAAWLQKAGAIALRIIPHSNMVDSAPHS